MRLFPVFLKILKDTPKVSFSRAPFILAFPGNIMHFTMLLFILECLSARNRVPHRAYMKNRILFTPYP